MVISFSLLSLISCCNKPSTIDCDKAMNKTIINFFLLVFVCWNGLYAQPANETIYLWKNGAPGFEVKRNEPEQAQDYWVKNIHNPSLTVYLPPKEKANGAAVIICPGGGHNKLVITAEGAEAAEYFNSIGVTAFVLKYRLFREDGSPYTEVNALEDGVRAMKLVRAMATQWSIDTNRIGLMGFSAGGELAGWVAFDTITKLRATDKIDLATARPSFLILVYPGPLAVPATLPSQPPALFMVAANDDACCSEPIIKLLQQYRNAKASVEVHLYAEGNHAFNMGKRSKLRSVHDWPQRLTDWLTDRGLLNKK